ncbi:MAG: hypothetical protein ACHQKZ_10695, partial [Solirubrobacterales bacterium]
MSHSLIVPRWTPALLMVALATGGCNRPAPAPSAIRLVDAFDTKLVEGTPAKAAASTIRRTEWRFDGPAPSPAPP